MEELPSVLDVTHNILNDTLNNEFHDPSFSLDSSKCGPPLSLPPPPTYTTNKQPALTINTSHDGPRIVSAADKGLERTDEELISPFSWHCDSVQSLQWSPEFACDALAAERSNDTAVQDGPGVALGTGALVDAQYAPLYQECLNNMSNTQMAYGGGHVTELPESSYEAGDAVSGSGNSGGSLDSILAEGGVKFNWAGTTGIPTPSSIGVPQNFSASSLHGQEWLGYFEGPAIVDYESVNSTTETYHPEGYRSQNFANEVPQPLSFQAVTQSAKRALEEIPTQYQEAETNAHGNATANATAIHPTHDSPRHSDMPLNRSVIPVPTDTSTSYPSALQTQAHYQHAIPVCNRITKRRKPFQDQQKRIKTGRTRKSGACARCRMQRIRVSQSALEAS